MASELNTEKKPKRCDAFVVFDNRNENNKAVKQQRDLVNIEQ